MDFKSICITLLLLAGFFHECGAQTSAEEVIQAQPLTTALQQFSRQTGLQIIYESRLAEGIVTETVAWTTGAGRLSRRAMLRKLLAGSGLAYKFINSNTLTIRRTAAPGNDSSERHPPPASATDRLMLEELIVTGIATGVGQSKFDAAYAISTIDAGAIERRSPQGMAELVAQTPGLFAESTGGVLGNNVYSRGLPNDNFRYVRTLEDGLPTFEEGAGAFTNADIFSRVDATIERVEIVRGGSGAITASNAPGSTVNTLTRKGTQKQQGRIKFSTSNYGLYRADLNVSGPLTEDLLYHLGGHQLSDRGLRDSGFTANRGGQYRAGLNLLQDSGELYLGFKRIDDNNTFYTPIPMASPRQGLPGLDPGTGSMVSREFSNLLVFDGDGNRSKRVDVADGVTTEINSWTLLLDRELNQRWRMSNSFRQVSGDIDYTAVFSGTNEFEDLSNELTALQAVNPQTSALRYRYVHGDGALLRQEQLPNGLLVSQGLWQARVGLENTINDLLLNRHTRLASGGSNDLMLGFYYSRYNQRQRWNWQEFVNEATHRPRLLDIVGIDSSGRETIRYTDAGIWKHHSNLQAFRDAVSHRAIYLTDTWQIDDAWRIDIGARWQQVRKAGSIADTMTVDLGDPDTIADDSVAIFSGSKTNYRYRDQALAWTLGFNYQATEKLALFGRHSDAYRFTGEFAQWFACCQPTESNIALQELGLKFAGAEHSAFVVLFANRFPEIAFSNQVVDASGNVVTETADSASRARGIEWELAWLPTAWLELQFNGFYQKIEYTDFNYVTTDASGNELAGDDFTGNRILRQPNTVMSLRPTIYVGEHGSNLYGALNYTGSRYVDAANSLQLPSYLVIDLGLEVNLSDNLRVQLLARNLTNRIGVTEGNPRNGAIVAAPSDIFYGRPIFGRSLQFSATLDF